MPDTKIIKGTEDEIWQEVTSDLNRNSDLFEYSVIIEQDARRIQLDILIDLGGGFEGGFENTMFRTPLNNTTHDFKFAVHHQGFIDEIGKFFGMQDVVIGYPEFDKSLIIRSNNEAKVKAAFSDADVREAFQSLHDFTFGIIMHHVNHSDKAPFLEFYSDVAITDALELRKIYNAFYKVLTIIDPVS